MKSEILASISQPIERKLDSEFRPRDRVDFVDNQSPSEFLQTWNPRPNCVDLLQELPAPFSFFPPHARRFEHEKSAANTMNYQGNSPGCKEISDEKTQPCPFGR